MHLVYWIELLEMKMFDPLTVCILKMYLQILYLMYL